jgi:hypothetical protein
LEIRASACRRDPCIENAREWSGNSSPASAAAQATPEQQEWCVRNITSATKHHLAFTEPHLRCRRHGLHRPRVAPSYGARTIFRGWHRPFDSVLQPKLVDRGREAARAHRRRVYPVRHVPSVFLIAGCGPRGARASIRNGSCKITHQDLLYGMLPGRIRRLCDGYCCVLKVVVYNHC